MSIFIIIQFILITIQIGIVCAMVYKQHKYTLTEEQFNDYQKANWICCAGVFLMMILSFIF